MLILFFFMASSNLQAEDLCEFFKYCPGSSQRRGGKSLPSAIISGSLNPATLSKIKGLGVEGVYQPNNPLALGLVTGTGKIGALLSSSQENSFFGNRSIELENDFFIRHEEGKHYKNKKFSFATGMGIFDNRDIALDAGLTFKHNPDTKKMNPGIGLSGNIGFFTFGYSVYQDDTKLDLSGEYDPYTGLPYSVKWGSDTYVETFTVNALALGLRVGRVFFDYGHISTKYKFYNSEPTDIRLFSASYNLKKLLFNLAFRHETSPNFKYEEGTLVFERDKKDIYGGVQYSFNKHVLIGVAYNRFLLKDTSVSLTLSF